MIKRITLLSSLGLMLLTATSVKALDKTVICPSVALIKSVGIQHIQKAEVSDNGWLAWSKSNYNTDDTWFFSFVSLRAKNQSIALKKAMKKLEKLATVEGPEQVDGAWVCLYSSAKGHLEDMAMAQTPSPL
jgi:hypothetical protein